jgi:hypothetical protein
VTGGNGEAAGGALTGKGITSRAGSGIATGSAGAAAGPSNDHWFGRKPEADAAPLE